MKVTKRFSKLTEVTVHLLPVDIADLLSKQGHVPDGFSLLEMEADDDGSGVTLRFSQAEERPELGKDAGNG